MKNVLKVLTVLSFFAVVFACEPEDPNAAELVTNEQATGKNCIPTSQNPNPDCTEDPDDE